MGKLAPHIFQCKFCGQVNKGMTVPSSLKCDSAFYHAWNELGIEGTITFECEKCATVIKSTKTPVKPNCPNGNNHVWKKVV